MKYNWSAILIGFAVTLVLGFVAGIVSTGPDASMVLTYWGAIGVLGGLTAGYLAGGTVSSGAVHGGIATVFGAIVLLALATLTTLLFAGVVPTFGLVVLGGLMIALHAVPGALGGAIGSWVKDRRSAPETMGTRA